VTRLDKATGYALGGVAVEHVPFRVEWARGLADDPDAPTHRERFTALKDDGSARYGDLVVSREESPVVTWFVVLTFEPVSAPVCLLTAFEPFGGKPVNASWEAIRDFEGHFVEGHRIVARRLPVVYDGMAAPLDAAIAAARPSVVVSFGLGRDRVHVERTAKNSYDPRKPADNLGKPPPRDEIAPGGPKEKPSGLPVDAIVAALREEGLAADPSDDAGGYLCNECFFRLMTGSATGVRAKGFVHLPDLDAPNPAGGTYSLDRLRDVVRTVVETTIRRGPPPGG
jgi:pyroglutamyl-peptidase